LIVEKERITTQNELVNHQSEQKCYSCYPATQIEGEIRRRENSILLEIESRERSITRSIAETNQRGKRKVNSEIKITTRESIRQASWVGCFESQTSSRSKWASCTRERESRSGNQS